MQASLLVCAICRDGLLENFLVQFLRMTRDVWFDSFYVRYFLRREAIARRCLLAYTVQIRITECAIPNTIIGDKIQML
jgi:hypothetical protein